MSLETSANERVGRGRPRSFDVSDAVDAALELFWQRGYRATTTRDLERALCVSQSSIYQAFGSKRGLLVAAIDRYEARVTAELLCELDEAPRGYAAIDRFLSALQRWISAHPGRGCLAVNLMTADCGDAIIDDRVRSYRARLRLAFCTALGAEPGLSPAQVDEQTDLVLAAVLGVHVAARAHPDSHDAEAMLRALRVQLADWRASRGRTAPRGSAA